jgi:hypothetical protein
VNFGKSRKSDVAPETAALRNESTWPDLARLFTGSDSFVSKLAGNLSALAFGTIIDALAEPIDMTTTNATIMTEQKADLNMTSSFVRESNTVFKGERLQNAGYGSLHSFQ